MHERDPDDEDWKAIRSGVYPSFVDGPAFTSRVVAALDAIAARQDARASAVVVCHAGVINTYLAVILGLERPLTFPLHHTSVSPGAGLALGGPPRELGQRDPARRGPAVTDPEPAPDVDPDVDPDRLGPERLLAFSDGVVAIALTLLVLPLAELVPEAEEPTGSGLGILTDNLSLIGSFALSFVVIARFWAAHHRVFDGARRVGPAIVWVNTAWLFTIVVLPFPTEMVGTLPRRPVHAALLRAHAVRQQRAADGHDGARPAHSRPPTGTHRRGTPRPGPRPACCSWSSW